MSSSSSRGSVRSSSPSSSSSRFGSSSPSRGSVRSGFSGDSQTSRGTRSLNRGSVRSGRQAGTIDRSSSVGSGSSRGTIRSNNSDSPSTSRRGTVAASTQRGTVAAGGSSQRGTIGAGSGTRTIHGGGHDRGYARPGRPGGMMPPAARPIHPAPYFHHPWHHHMVHCHPIFWDPIPPRPWYWPGFWVYCNSYWYDYHVTDVVVVHDYVEKTYNVDLVTYGISGDIMYAIVRDGGDTYLQVYDKDDHLLAEQKINRKYCNMVIDAENGGCWISKKNNKDPLLFIWADGQLLIYEED